MAEPSPTWQFWLNWVAQVAIAFGTLAAVVVALFGRWLRVGSHPLNSC